VIGQTNPVRQLLADYVAVERELFKRSLRDYVEEAWSVVEPGTPFSPGWHIDAICDHLEAVSGGDVQDLIINVPPRFMKSMLVSVFWPTWVWISKPETRWLTASYAQSLSIRDARRSRTLLNSYWYRQRWGHVFHLADDQNVKGRYENSRMGYRIATSVGGSATGEGGDFIIVDDPHNVKEGESDAAREATILWWNEVMATRLDNQLTGARVIIMQRVHERDLTGHEIAKDMGYEHLMLPMRYEPDRRCTTSIGFKDPRKAEGELLWEKRFPMRVVDRLERSLGVYGTAGQLQQRPAPRGGGMMLVENIKVVDRLSAPIEQAARGWDKAATEGGGCYSAGVKMARLQNGRFAVLHVRRGQWSTEKREAAMRACAQQDGVNVCIHMEQEPGSSGVDSAKATIKSLAGYAARAHRATGDKVHRAEPLAAQIEAGNVEVLRGEWNDAFFAELAVFPAGQRKDQVDAAALVFNQLALGAAGWSDFYGDEENAA